METQTHQQQGRAQANKLKEMTEDALETLCLSLEEGKSDELLKYLDVMSKFSKYSFRNMLLIFSQMPDATRVMGFHSWKQLQRSVKKGEKAIRIWAPMNIKNEEGQRVGGESQLANGGESDRTLIFRPVCVFDVSQTEGEPLPEISNVSGEPGEYLYHLKEFTEELGIKLGYSEELNGDGVSKCGEILLRLGLAPAVEFHVLVHELAHEMIHLKDYRNGLTKKQAETEAEAVAYVVSKTIGLNMGNAASDYIQLYNGSQDTLRESLEVVQRTASKITQALIKN